LYSQGFSLEYIVKYKIKSLAITDSVRNVSTVEFFNEKGNVIMSGIKQPRFMIFTKQIAYDEFNHPLEERMFTPKMEYNGVVRYSYNSENQVIKKEAFDADDVLEAVWTYEHDATGKKIKETRKNAKNEKLYTKYKHDGERVIEEGVSNDKNVVVGKTTYTFNKQQLLIEQKYTNLLKKETSIIMLKYNNNNLLISKTEKENDIVVVTTLYFYNDKGLVERSEKKNSSGEEFKFYYQVELFQ